MTMPADKPPVNIKLNRDEASTLNNVLTTFIMSTEGATSPDEVAMLTFAKELQKRLAQILLT
jgi:hypothetical protein